MCIVHALELRVCVSSEGDRRQKKKKADFFAHPSYAHICSNNECNNSTNCLGGLLKSLEQSPPFTM